MLDWKEIVLRLLLAAFFGALVGLERERKHWAAGLRTHMMVCVGSGLVMMVSAFGFSDILGTPNVTLDPSRIAAQVVSGIGFIGAGTILFLKEGIIRGLTTAAGLWTVAAIGLATGGGMYFAASITTVIALIILWGIRPLERIYFGKTEEKSLKIITTPEADTTKILKSLSEIGNINVLGFSFDKELDHFVFQINMENLNFSELEKMIGKVKENPEVKEVFWS